MCVCVAVFCQNQFVRYSSLKTFQTGQRRNGIELICMFFNKSTVWNQFPDQHSSTNFKVEERERDSLHISAQIWVPRGGVVLYYALDSASVIDSQLKCRSRLSLRPRQALLPAATRRHSRAIMLIPAQFRRWTDGRFRWVEQSTQRENITFSDRYHFPGGLG